MIRIQEIHFIKILMKIMLRFLSYFMWFFYLREIEPSSQPRTARIMFHKNNICLNWKNDFISYLYEVYINVYL